MKRKTKKDDVRARMLRRVADIYHGVGVDFCNEFEPLASDLPRLIRGVVEAFGITTSENPIVAYWNLDEYASPEKLTDFLLGHGVKP